MAEVVHLSAAQNLINSETNDRVRAVMQFALTKAILVVAAAMQERRDRVIDLEAVVLVAREMAIQPATLRVMLEGDLAELSWFNDD